MSRALLAVATLCLSCGPTLPSTPVTAAEPAPVPEATWAGKTSDENTLVAIVAGHGQAQLYFCDGTLDTWFRGAIDGPTASLETDEGSVVFDLFNERAFGAFRRGDGTVLTFDVPRDDGAPLSRHEDSVGGDPVLGGWIHLPDGTQRGLVRVGGVPNTSSLTIASSVLQTASCPQCGAVGPLKPAAFTPASLGEVRTNLPRTFTYVALGESYLSGEGSPATAGGPFSDDGMLGGGGAQEFWGDGLPKGLPSTFLSTTTRERMAREAKACHRSDRAASVLARAELERRWPGVSFSHMSFACSGAQVPQLVDARDTGSADCDQKSGAARTECYQWADDLPVADAVAPQFAQLDAFANTWGVPVDGVVLSIGGNDMGFGLVIEDCLKDDCARANGAGGVAFTAGVAALPARYEGLKAALATRRISPARVGQLLYPNPLRRSESAACAPGDYPDLEVILKEVTLPEADFAYGVHERMNATVKALAADAGFVVAESHVARTVGHSMCSGAEAWFNTTHSALKTQGVDLPPVPGPLGIPFRVSTGMVHPNVKGHQEMYLPAVMNVVDQLVARKFAPASPTRVRVVSATRSGMRLTARLAWDDRSAFESSYQVSAPDFPVYMHMVAADSAGTTVVLDGVTPEQDVSLHVVACFSGPVTACSPAAVAVASTSKPDLAPAGLSATTAILTGVGSLGAGWRLTWGDVASRRHAFYTVELVDETGRVTARGAEKNTLVMSSTQQTHFRVASCNFNGCGPASGWTRLPAGGSGTNINICPGGSVQPAFGNCTGGLTR